MNKCKVCTSCSIIAVFILSICILHPNNAIAEVKDPIYGELVQKGLDLKI